jgi:hypothetical protein
VRALAVVSVVISACAKLPAALPSQNSTRTNFPGNSAPANGSERQVCDEYVKMYEDGCSVYLKGQGSTDVIIDTAIRQAECHGPITFCSGTVECVCVNAADAGFSVTFE